MEDLLKSLCGTSTADQSVDRVALWTMIVALATIVLFLIAWYQLRGLRKVSKADFMNRFSVDFFKPLNRNFILLCDCDCIELKGKEIEYENETWSFPYFEVIQDRLKQLPLNSKEYPIADSYTCYEIDDFLGYFEDIGKFEKRSLIDIQDVYDSFDWYIRTAHKNCAIQEYLSSQSSNEGDFYENFNYIFHKCKSFGQAKSDHRWMWLWGKKWWLSNKILKR